MWFEPSFNLPKKFNVTPIHIGEHSNQPPVTRPNGYRWNLFIWVTKGSGSLKINDVNYTINEGRGFFIKKDIPHFYSKTDEFFSTQWVAFQGGEDLFKYFDIDDYLIFNTPKTLRKSANHLENVCKNNSAPIRAAQTYMWIAELLENITSSKSSLSANISEYLEENCQHQITLNELSSKFNIDKYWLCHKYNIDTGISIMKALKNIRLQKAKRLLKYCDYSIEEIAQLCGYESPSYFIKLFKEEIGTTPAQYRKKH